MENQLLEIDGLLLPKYLIILVFEKHTKEMPPKWIYMKCFIHLFLVHLVCFVVGGETTHFNTYNRPKTKGGKCGNTLIIWLWVWAGTLLKII